MKRLLRPALTLLVILGIAWWLQGAAPDAGLQGRGDDAPALQERAGWPEVSSEAPAPPRLPEFLPPEAVPVLEAIHRGGPFEYRKDGTVFQNREGLLPRQPRGYYREFTVETPGSPDRGARRIVTGGDPPIEFWYTEDHYRSFRRFEAPREALR